MSETPHDHLHLVSSDNTEQSAGKGRGLSPERASLADRVNNAMIALGAYWDRYLPALIISSGMVLYTGKQGVDSGWTAFEAHLYEEAQAVQEEARQIPEDLLEVYEAFGAFIKGLKTVDVTTPLIESAKRLWGAIQEDYNEAKQGVDFHPDRLGEAFYNTHEDFFVANPHLKKAYDAIMEALKRVAERGASIASKTVEVARFDSSDLQAIAWDAATNRFPKEMLGYDTSPFATPAPQPESQE